MAEVDIKDGESLEQALRRFKRVSSEITRDARKQEHYLRPALAKKEKEKEARKRAAMARKKGRR